MNTESTSIKNINYNCNTDINTNVAISNKKLPFLSINGINNLAITNENRQIHKLLFSSEIYELITHFLQNNDINSLTYDQLVRLSKMYIFTEDDLISLEINSDFFEYLNKNNIISFDKLPKALHANVPIAKKAFLAGYYDFFIYIPMEQQTPDIYQKFLEFFNSNDCQICYLQYLAENLQTAEMWDTALTGYFTCITESFKKIPEKFKTPKRCMQFYRKRGNYDFSILDETVKTFDLCKEYIDRADKIDLNLIPKQFITQLQDLIITKFSNSVTNSNYKEIYKNNKRRLYKSLKGIEILPTTLLKENPNIIIKACWSYPETINKIDTSLITNEILHAIASMNINHIPEQYITIDIILTKLNKIKNLSNDEITTIDAYFLKNKEEMQKLALKIFKKNNNVQLLRYIPVPLTKEQCLGYIKINMEQYKYLPDKYKFNVDIILQMLQMKIDSIHTLNSSYLCQEQYQQIFENFPNAPAWELDSVSYINYIKQKPVLLETIPKEHRSLDIWIYLCNNKNTELITEIPEQLLTKAGFTYLVDERTKRNFGINITFIEKVLCHKFFDDNIRMKILNHALQCSARSCSIVIKIMKSRKIPVDFKQDLWKNIQLGNFTFPAANPEGLYKKDNPLKLATATAFISEFLTNCYKFSSYNDLCLPRITQALQTYITQYSQIEELPLDIENNNFTNAKVTGGRTIQVDISSTEAMFYKFRKRGEELSSFIKEGVFFEFLHKNIQGQELKLLLKSEIPILKKLVRIPAYKLPKCAFKCDDNIDTFQDSQNNKCVDVLIFITAKDYLKYAHIEDSKNTDNPYKKGEQGLLKAIYDIGVFTSIGVYHTSTLPAFHSITNKRRWIPLHMLMRLIRSDFIEGDITYPVIGEMIMTGKLDNWNTTATERPDYGYTGLRDFADYELFGEINMLSEKNIDLTKNFPLITQNILAANTICECLIASILLYARLHHKSPYYYYKNDTYKKRTAEFIEKLFTNFLAGRLQQDNVKLQEFMQLTDDDYHKWLDRTVTELLYWTAKKHSLSSITSNAEIPDIDFNDHHQVHILNRKLPEDLYNHYHMLENKKFALEYEVDNLGLANATFPLLALTNFIFLLNSKLKENNV